MKLQEARETLRQVDGKGYNWLKVWGMSTIREALRTVFSRKAATIEDRQLAEGVQTKLSRGW